MLSLEAAVLRTIAWFDIFQYPITSFECWHYLYIENGSRPSVTPHEVQQALEGLASHGVVRVEQGMWGLVGSAASAKARLTAARVAIHKRHRALQAARWLQYLPFVRFVGLANTLALGVARPEGDIDLLIVLARGRLFLGRLLVTAVIQVLGWRRHDKKVKDRLCLSFYLDDEHLDLAALAYDDDPYLRYWVASLVPLTGAAAYERFLRQNHWIDSALPHWRGARGVTASVCLPRGEASRILAQASEFFIDLTLTWWAEPWSRRWQLKRIRRHTSSRLGDGTKAVVVADGVLKFHESDRRRELAQAWRRRLAELASTVL